MKQKALKASYKLGIERESLRIQEDGLLSKKSHPLGLGDTLTNRYITTDFAESQLELITPPVSCTKDALIWLESLTQFVYHEIDDEILWPFSMPFNPPLNPLIAKYGTTKEAVQKMLYRKGLLHRYGAPKQLISGLHVNWSLDDEFWVSYKNQKKSNLSLQEWKSEQYMHVIRNYIRYSWIIPYFFGATPCASIHLKQDPCFATSLRLGNSGYVNSEEGPIQLSYNSLDEYIKSMRILLNTEAKKFAHVKEQLNSYVLQKEEEHYFFIRPKSPVIKNLKALDGLEQKGIQFLEIRSFDINPLSPVGIDENALSFIHKLLMHCLLEKSPPLSKEEFSLCMQNHERICSCGRDPELTLSFLGETKKASEHAQKICEILSTDVPRSISAQIEEGMTENNMSYFEFGVHLGKKYKKDLLQKPLRQKCQYFFQNHATLSHVKKQILEGDDTLPIPTMQDMELSTQLLIREAIRRDISVEILDRQENFIRLEEGLHVEYIKQATKTQKDSYISFLMMENKNVSKQLFDQYHINTPRGETYDSPEEAKKAFCLWKESKVAVKPSTGNFGDGITIGVMDLQKTYDNAIDKAALVSQSIIVEEFVLGDKYRFLLFGDHLAAISKGIPANVQGDGVHSIADLILEKNKKKHLTDPIVLSEEDIKNLEQKNLSLKTVLEKDQTIYFREVSNSPQGGDTIDATDSVHESYIEIAKRAQTSAQAKICGVDIMIQDPAKPATENNYSVLEVNFNPGIALHEVPLLGTPRRVTRALLDFLGF